MTPRLLLGLGLLLGWAVSVSGQPPPPPAGQKGETGGRHALLVGCTRYDNLEEKWQLDGPTADIPLLTGRLKERYGFTDADVVELSEAAARRDGPTRRPTRANIEREFAELAKRAGEGDQVVIWLSGHGSRQYSDPPNAPPKPDGEHEMFLPCDVGEWDGRAGEVSRAVLDYELRDWLKQITDRKAFVWVIVDACHSATLCREGPGGRTKEVPPDELKIPPAAPRPARSPAGPSGLDLAAGNDHLVAFYACEPSETTPEWNNLDPTGAFHALFTWMLCQELEQHANGPLTYRELLEGVRARYEPWVVHPHPLVEFAGQDRLVLGRERLVRRSFLLGRGDGQTWRLAAGLLHGLTPGSVLEVRPPAGQGDGVLGHVRVAEARPLQSDVKPCAYADVPAPAADALVADCRCRPVLLEGPPLRLRLAVVSASAPHRLSAEQRGSERERLLGEADAPSDRRKAVADRLRAGADKDGAVYEMADDPSRADWLVVVSEKGATLEGGGSLAAELAGPPADVRLLRGADGSAVWLADDGRRPAFPLPDGDDARAGEAAKILTRAARAELLCRAAAATATAPAPPDLAPDKPDFLLEVQFFHKADPAGDKEVEFDPAQSPPRRGETVACKVVNRSEKSRVAVTILSIDSDFHVKVLYPPGEELNHLFSANHGGPPVEMRVGEGGQPGPEHLLVFAVRPPPGKTEFAGDAVPDFAWLAQEDAEQARDAFHGARAPGKQTFDSPLGRLFRTAVFRDGRERGVPASAQADYLVLTRSWEPAPPAKP